MQKIALITGASSGIGMATARKFADLGLNLILCGRREDRLIMLTKELSSKIECTWLKFDVADFSQCKNAIESLSSPWKNIQILINNAGNAHGLGPIQEGDIEDWNAMIDSNVKGLLNVSRIITPIMVANQVGHIVNISSVAGKLTYENGAVYCATKKSVEAISEGMRYDLTKHSIKISNIAPGAVETEFSITRFKGDTERAAKVYEGFDQLLADDIASAICYCIQAPDHVTIADMTIYAKAQAAPTVIYRK